MTKHIKDEDDEPMETEFNLSEKIKQMDVNDNGERGFCKGIDIKDVKKFIKRLKEEFWEAIEGGVIDMNAPNKIIDKLAGEELK